MQGRDFVLPEDVQNMAPNILLHRMTYTEAENQKQQLEVFNRVLAKIPVPLEG